jgi:uncharacterized protein
MDPSIAHKKKETLLRRLEGLDTLLIAFSGGVDSSFLLEAAHRVLGSKVIAVTATSVTFSKAEQKGAEAFTRERGIEHLLFLSDETELPEFRKNSPDRCYYCKKHLFRKIWTIAQERHIPHVAHAANVDDLSDYRPGARAAHEMGALAPLIDAGLTKREIRFLSKEMGLDTWNKPSMACLASRFPYGETITEEKLTMVDRGEAYLARLGFRQYRVRYHGDVARIEVMPEDFGIIANAPERQRIIKAFREIGFLHVALDLEGYVSGSLNRALSIEPGTVKERNDN